MKNLGRNQVASTCVKFLPPAFFGSNHKPRSSLGATISYWDGACLVKMTVKVGVEGISKMVEEHDR